MGLLGATYRAARARWMKDGSRYGYVEHTAQENRDIVLRAFGEVEDAIQEQGAEAEVPCDGGPRG